MKIHPPIYMESRSNAKCIKLSLCFFEEKKMLLKFDVSFSFMQSRCLENKPNTFCTTVYFHRISALCVDSILQRRVCLDANVQMSLSNLILQLKLNRVHFSAFSLESVPNFLLPNRMSINRKLNINSSRLFHYNNLYLLYSVRFDVAFFLSQPHSFNQ